MCTRRARGYNKRHICTFRRFAHTVLLADVWFLERGVREAWWMLGRQLPRSAGLESSTPIVISNMAVSRRHSHQRRWRPLDDASSVREPGSRLGRSTWLIVTGTVGHWLVDVEVTSRARGPRSLSRGEHAAQGLAQSQLFGPNLPVRLSLLGVCCHIFNLLGGIVK